MDRFWEMLCIRGVGHDRYGSMIVDWRKSYANTQCDLYSEDLTAMIDTMHVMEWEHQTKK